MEPYRKRQTYQKGQSFLPSTWNTTQASIAPLALHLKFGWEARLPMALTFGIGDIVTSSHNDHAKMIQSSLAYAYSLALTDNS